MVLVFKPQKSAKATTQDSSNSQSHGIWSCISACLVNFLNWMPNFVYKKVKVALADLLSFREASLFALLEFAQIEWWLVTLIKPDF